MGGTYLIVVEIAGVAAHALVAARAERVRTVAGQHDHADVRVLARILQRLGDLDDRSWAKGVAHLGSRDRDLRDPLIGRGGLLVVDVGVLAVGRRWRWDPGGAHRRKASYMNYS